MKKIVKKGAKIALCRKCRGTGEWHYTGKDGLKYAELCPQCEGSGRVTVSAVMEFDIRPYKNRE